MLRIQQQKNIILHPARRFWINVLNGYMEKFLVRNMSSFTGLIRMTRFGTQSKTFCLPLFNDPLIVYDGKWSSVGGRIMATVNIREALLQEVSVLPTGYCPEVLDFISSLKTNRQPAIPETMLLSEEALAEDWDSPEDNEAWANL